MARLQGRVQYSLMLVDPGPFSHGGVSWHAGVPTALAEQMSEVVSKSGFGRALGNAISTNVLERLLHGVMRVTNLAAVEPEDFWARHCSRFPKREAGSRGSMSEFGFPRRGYGDRVFGRPGSTSTRGAAFESERVPSRFEPRRRGRQPRYEWLF